jgi:sulfur carrier protein ThiS
VACAPQDVQAATVRAALAAAFSAAPALQDYVLDEQGGVRKHVAVFVNGDMLPRDGALDRALERADRVMVIQALTGG